MFVSVVPTIAYCGIIQNNIKISQLKITLKTKCIVVIDAISPKQKQKQLQLQPKKNHSLRDK